MDDRMCVGSGVALFAELIRREAGVVAFYVGGSLALGDYRPNRSDLDLAAVIERPLPRPARRALRAFHRSFALRYADAGKLHCAYVPRAELDDVSRPHLA